MHQNSLLIIGLKLLKTSMVGLNKQEGLGDKLGIFVFVSPHPGEQELPSHQPNEYHRNTMTKIKVPLISA